MGAITELVGPESSGRTSLALSFIGQLTKAGKVCAWVDVSNALHPESAAASGIERSRLLWVRCGVQAAATIAMTTSARKSPIRLKTISASRSILASRSMH